MPLDPICQDPRVQVAAQSLPFPTLFVSVSGAHLYGFASPDSDVDLRACHLLPLQDFAGLDAPRETLEISRQEKGLDWDIVSHDARKFFGLLLKGSGYALEQVLSPLLVCQSDAHDELCDLARQTISRHHARHYLGFARNQWRLFGSENPPRVKPLLYTFRVLLTGIHLMRTGILNANLEELNHEFQVPRIAELIALKGTTREKITLPHGDSAFFVLQFERLLIELLASQHDSSLPPYPQNRDAFDAFLRRLRIAA